MTFSSLRGLQIFSSSFMRHSLRNYHFGTSSKSRCIFTRRHFMCHRFFGFFNALRYQATEKANLNNDLSDEALFDEGFTVASNYLTTYFKSLAVPEVSQWFEKVINYNVPNGKRNRGFAVLKTFKVLVPDSSVEERKLASLLGWCIELCQAYFLVMDDIMDQSSTRRGLPCWYRQEEVGLNAVNDAILLESGMYQILKGHFSHHSNYTDMVDAFHETVCLTSMGQCLDMMSTPNNGKPNLDRFSSERHSDICRLKTSYYTFCLPVRLALLLAGKGHCYTKEVDTLLLTMGHLFQVQDDYLDVMGDTSATGKQGTDIESGKCSWPIVTALPRASSEAKLLLKEHYGRKEPESIEIVKNIYKSVDITGCYETYESETYVSICKQIEELSQTNEIPAQVFHFLLNKIYKRRK